MELFDGWGEKAEDVPYEKVSHRRGPNVTLLNLFFGIKYSTFEPQYKIVQRVATRKKAPPERDRVKIEKLRKPLILGSGHPPKLGNLNFGVFEPKN